MSDYVFRSCRQCDRPMRPNRARAADYPGTLAHKARMLCSGCYNAGCSGCYNAGCGFGLGSESEARASIEATKEALAAYLRWRSPFRTKAAQDIT